MFSSTFRNYRVSRGRFCNTLERAASIFYVMASAAWRDGNKRLFSQLEGIVCLLFSAIRLNFQMPRKDQTVKNSSGFCLFSLDRPAKVPVIVGALLIRPTSSCTVSEIIEISAERNSPTYLEQCATLGHLEAFRSQHFERGFWTMVVELLMAGNRPKTQAPYESAW